MKEIENHLHLISIKSTAKSSNLNESLAGYNQVCQNGDVNIRAAGSLEREFTRFKIQTATGRSPGNDDLKYG